NQRAMSEKYAPPPGPPPTWKDSQQQSLQRADYEPPSGPPPGYQAAADDYAPPPGPPPSHSEKEQEPPPYDPWLAVPDSSFLPPPPSFQDDRSPTANATADDAERGHAWCAKNPLWRPTSQPPQTLQRIANGDLRLTTPPRTKNVASYEPGFGRTHVKTTAACGDTIFLSDLPVYTATTHSPTTIYYELKVLSMGHISRTGEADAGIALGFLAPPYPSWRLPGWHRASLAVHGDDGRRYVNNTLGGKDFTQAFRKGDVVGIGMTFSPPVYQGGTPRVDVFFTRNGKRDGAWDLHEERDRDATEGNVYGLEGKHDLLAAVGCFGAVEFEVRFRKQDWLFKL
ncbi:hypothetical protein BAUCODRAFT_66048, partial [Baudoinia panamericana UAMH 10762]